jgi:hypothetical protein
MTRRRVLLLGSVAVVAALVVTWWALPRPSAIHQENAAKVKEGMTLAEVEAILGGPPRDESTMGILRDAVTLDDAIQAKSRIDGPRQGTGKPDGSIHRWASDAAYIRIIGNTAGGVWTVDWVPVRLESDGILDALRRRIGL